MNAAAEQPSRMNFNRCSTHLHKGKQMAKQFRRLVTGHDADGKSVVLFDGPPPTVLATDARPGATMTGIWDTTSTPATIAGNADAYAHAINLMPPRLGTQCIALELQPE